MSEANKALCRRFIEEIWNQRNFDLNEEILTANYVDHDPANPDFGRGPESHRKLTNYYLTAFPDTKFTIEDTFAEGDRVFLRWNVRGTHRGNLGGIPPTGKNVNVSGMVAFRVANNKITESWTNWDALGLFRQIGVVSEQTGRATA